ncbi:hypothetical protein H5410_034406 [Solanum commersonii]|uniref:Uncharacterized protein n=1 Tax=Solanum commersonii TaxID=4109 RepID=A0A9J5YVG0_SOLCO|nr:hypothetical protein H5410_034406 [Solanum commersonii]
MTKAFAIVLLLALNDNIAMPLREILVHQQQQSDEILCIIYDSIMYKVAEVANNLNIPSVILETSSANLFWTYAAFHRLEAEDSIAEDLVPRLDPLSIGSLASITEREVTEIAWGLVNSNQHFLWVIRSGSITGSDLKLVFHEKSLREAIDIRGYIVEWAPQKEVLGHFAIGGRPCFGDQNVNSRYASYVWKVGIVLERGEIERVVRKLMVSDEGEEIRQRAMDFKLEIENSVAENGTSYKCLDALVKFLLSL